MDVIQIQNCEVMTTQALAETITLRHELPLEDLLKFAPQLAGYVLNQPAATVSSGSSSRTRTTSADRAFWTTFVYGSAQAVVLFLLIYAYFAS